MNNEREKEYTKNNRIVLLSYPIFRIMQILLLVQHFKTIKSNAN
jgi:hypothetical protein